MPTLHNNAVISKIVNNSVVFEPRLIGDGSRYTLLELFASEPGVLKDLHAVTRGDPREDALRMASVSVVCPISQSNNPSVCLASNG